eukprot:SAG11_NODE_420_length_9631_cov_12.805558_9_plen_98_part_00
MIGAGAVFNSMGKEVSQKKFAKVFAQIDSSGNEQIDFDELLIWWRSQSKKERVAIKAALASGKPLEEKLRALWKMLDIDESGLLDVEETQKIFSHVT